MVAKFLNIFRCNVVRHVGYSHKGDQLLHVQGGHQFDEGGVHGATILDQNIHDGHSFSRCQLIFGRLVVFLEEEPELRG